MDSDDPYIVQKAEDQWQTNCVLRYNRFQSCKKKLSKRLVHLLENCHFFHDTYIQEISLKKIIGRKQDTFDLILTMQYDGYEEPLNGRLIHREVQQLNSNMPNLMNNASFGSYLYGEIFINDQKMWVHNFILFEECELNIVCKKIEWEDVS